MQVNKVAIIGLGLIGGSIAKALKERTGVHYIGAIDSSESSLSMALKDGTICCGSDHLSEWFLDADIFFVCTPVSQACAYIEQIALYASPDCIVTDVGSSKAGIVRYVDAMNKPPVFIGGHPMAGTEKSGYMSSFSHMFENAYYVLTACSSTTPYSIDLLTGLVREIGALPVYMGAEEHDRVTAGISHVPHVIASALVNMVRELDSKSGKMQLLAAGGFKDITRIASSSPEMWQSIIMSNKEDILNILETYKSQVESFAQYLRKDDAQAVFSFFQNAVNFRKSFADNRVGMIQPVYEIVLDIVDRPGIIGEIASILGNNGINIKNINVSNSREFEQGCLRVTLPDAGSVDSAYEMLTARGYHTFKV